MKKNIYKETSESRKDYYKYLQRPDGKLLSEKDCLLLDLCIQWTKGYKTITSTYDWLLKNKFPRQSHRKTVKRTFDNISLYIDSSFKQKIDINNETHFNKILIERVDDFDKKIALSKQKAVQQCCPYGEAQMSAPKDTNVHTQEPKCPHPYIYKKEYNKDNNKDNINNQHNQFQNSENLVTSAKPKTENKIANSEYAEKSHKGLAREEFVHNTQAKISAKQDVVAYTTRQQKTPLANQTPSNSEQDIGDYHPMLLKNFPLTDRIIEEVLCKSNKPNYTIGKVRLIVRNILETTPNKPVYGGKTGLVKYLVQAVNNHVEYDNSDYTTNIFQKKNLTAEEQKIVDESWANNKIRWVSC